MPVPLVISRIHVQNHLVSVHTPLSSKHNFRVWFDFESGDWAAPKKPGPTRKKKCHQTKCACECSRWQLCRASPPPAASSKTSTSTCTRARITNTFMKSRHLAPWVLGALLSVQNMHWRWIAMPCLTYNEFLKISQQKTTSPLLETRM